MPLSIKRRKELLMKKYAYPIKHFCPRCFALHHWQANKCCRKGCGYVGPLALLNEKKGTK